MLHRHVRDYNGIRGQVLAACHHICILFADKYYIRRFLRARQHDLEKARHMYAEHVKWRKEFDVAGIVKDFNFHERDLFLTLYPQGYHKTDKLVSTSPALQPHILICQI